MPAISPCVPTKTNQRSGSAKLCELLSLCLQVPGEKMLPVGDHLPGTEALRRRRCMRLVRGRLPAPGTALHTAPPHSAPTTRPPALSSRGAESVTWQLPARQAVSPGASGRRAGSSTLGPAVMNVSIHVSEGHGGSAPCPAVHFSE